MNESARVGEDVLNQWLAGQHRALVDDLATVLDLETGLREAMIPAQHADLVNALNEVLDVEAGLSTIVPTAPDDSFQEWNRQRDILSEFIRATCEISASVDKKIAEVLGDIDAQLHRDSFRIMLVGRFSSGKSTLINAMVGEDLLPRGVNPSTAFPTVMHWGEESGAQMYRLDETGAETADAQRISIEEFRQLVRLEIGAEGLARQVSPHCRATVSVPLPLLANGVELIDSAGIDDDMEREKITLGLLAKSDAVIFVTPAVNSFGEQERERYLPLTQLLGHKDLFFVVNQFDRVDEPEDRARARQRCLAIAQKFTTDPERRVFCTSALDAFKARTGKIDYNRLESSGIPALEKALDDFCQHDRLRVKLGRPAMLLQHQILTLRDRIQDQRGMLRRNADELNTAFQAQASARENLTAQRQAIATQVQDWITETLRKVEQAATSFYRAQANDVSTWVNQLEITQKIRPLTSDAKEDLTKLANEIKQSLARRQRDDFAGFLTGREFRNLAIWQEGNFNRHLKPALRQYVANVRELRDELSCPEVAPGGRTVPTVPIADRIVISTLRVAVPELPASVGHPLEIREMLTTTGPMGAMGVIAAFTLGGGLVRAILAILLNTFLGIRAENARERIERSVRAQIAEAYAKELRDNAAQLGRQFADSMKPTLTRWHKELEAALEYEEHALVRDVDHTLKKLNEKTKTHERQQELDQAEATLNQIDRDLSYFIARLYGNDS